MEASLRENARTALLVALEAEALGEADAEAG